VQGLRIQVTPDGGQTNRQYAVTDENGLAWFRDLRPGSYFANVDHDARFPSGAALDVKLDRPSGTTVPLAWPSNYTVVSRSLKGTLYPPNFIAGSAASPMDVSLWICSTPYREPCCKPLAQPVAANSALTKSRQAYISSR